MNIKEIVALCVIQSSNKQSTNVFNGQYGSVFNLKQFNGLLIICICTYNIEIKVGPGWLNKLGSWIT